VAFRWFLGLLSLGQWMAVSAAAPTLEAIQKLPPAVGRSVDFRKDVQPILEASCVKCHGRGKANGDWKIDTRETFLQPGESGPAVVVGNSAHSYFIHLVAGTDPPISKLVIPSLKSAEIPCRIVRSPKLF
jgi:hypothetical protein